MHGRPLAIGAAAWTAGNAALYFAVIHAQGGSPAWWYVAVLAAVMTMLALAVADWRPRPLLIASAVLLAVCAVAGVLSIGLLLIPGAALALAAGLSWRSGKSHGFQRS
jgi:hypothetical protein